MLSLMTFCTYTVQTVPSSKKPTQFVLIDQRIFHNEVFHRFPVELVCIVTSHSRAGQVT